MGSYSDNTPAIHDLAQKMISNSMIDTSLYSKYNVKRGLRDLDGKGVLTGLTDISTIIQNKEVDGKLVPCDGELYYRGYNVNDIVGGILEDDRFGFEEVVYLLLFGEMPNVAQLKDFKELLVKYRTLPQNFVRDVILKAPSEDMMNSIARSVLTLFCYDDNPNDTTKKKTWDPSAMPSSTSLPANFPCTTTSWCSLTTTPRTAQDLFCGSCAKRTRRSRLFSMPGISVSSIRRIMGSSR